MDHPQTLRQPVTREHRVGNQAPNDLNGTELKAIRTRRCPEGIAGTPGSTASGWLSEAFTLGEFRQRAGAPCESAGEADGDRSPEAGHGTV